MPSRDFRRPAVLPAAGGHAAPSSNTLQMPESTCWRCQPKTTAPEGCVPPSPAAPTRGGTSPWCQPLPLERRCHPDAVFPCRGPNWGTQARNPTSQDLPPKALSQEGKTQGSDCTARRTAVLPPERPLAHLHQLQPQPRRWSYVFRGMQKIAWLLK